MRACMAGAAPAECAAREWGAAQQLVKGMYALPLAAWLAAYPRGALLALMLEELRRGRPATHPEHTLSSGVPDARGTTGAGWHWRNSDASPNQEPTHVPVRLSQAELLRLGLATPLGLRRPQQG